MAVSKVDRNAIKFNSVNTAAIAVAAFLFDASWLVGVQAIVLAATVAWPQWGLFRLLYQRIVLPLGLLRPNLLEDDPAAHRFTQGVAATFLALSWGSSTAGFSALGWTLAWIVVVLATIYVASNFCAGCFVYYQLRRFGLIRRAAQAD